MKRRSFFEIFLYVFSILLICQVSTFCFAEQLSKTTGKSDDSEAYFKKGLSNVTLNPQEAIRDLDKAIDLDQKNADAYAARGIANNSLRNYQQAIKDFNKAIELDPDNTAAYYGRGVSYLFGLNDPRQAIRDCDKAIELGPESDGPFFLRGQAYLELGSDNGTYRDFQKALEDLNMAIEIDPKVAELFFTRSQAYLRLGNYRRGLIDIDKAIDLRPRDAKYYYQKACLYSGMKNENEACKWLKVSIDKGFEGWKLIKLDNDLNYIRNASCYKEIMSGK